MSMGGNGAQGSVSALNPSQVMKDAQRPCVAGGGKFACCPSRRVVDEVGGTVATVGFPTLVYKFARLRGRNRSLSGRRMMHAISKSACQCSPAIRRRGR